jgi:IS30 family transposase
MPDLDSKKNKHMTLDDRLEMQECLNHGMTFKAIATRIGKDQTTISKEVKKHISVTNSDVRRYDKKGNPAVLAICPQLLKSPYVCNPCKQRHYRCAFQKHIYQAKPSQQEYEKLLVEARTGIPLNKEEFYEIDRIVSDGIKRGQHLYHIMQTNNLGISKSTVYRHLKCGYLSVSAIDFPRVVKFKVRKQRQSEYVPKAAKVGRTFEDFRAFIEENEISSWVEMDTVIGRGGGKVILTLDFTFCNFMVGLLLENKTAFETTEKITDLKNKFDSNHLRFGDIFPLVLTDNGGEFSNVFAIENNSDGQKESSLFFCDPFQSSQKPKVEKNHTLFRDIVPKGQSFDHFTQDTVNLIFSHVNSVKRKSLNGKAPCDVFTFTYGDAVTDILGIKPIPASQVIQSPKLIKP